MPLPILQTHQSASRDDLIRFYHRTELHWSRHVAEETTLDVGTAFTSPELARVRYANQMLDIILPPDMSAQQAMQQIEDHFREKGTQCANWSLAAGADEANARLLEHFQQIGFTNDSADIMYRANPPAGPIEEAPGLTIIPARASFRHTRALEEEAASEWKEPQVADAAMMHLDDPHVDSLLALKGTAAAGQVSVLAVGEIGCIEEIFVSAPFRGQGVGRTLMSRAMEICARSLFKHVFLSVDPKNAAAQALYSRFGFVKIGDDVAYHPPRP